MEYGPTTALIVVDVQNDFADPKGNLSVPGGEDVIDFINEQIQAASRAGSPVVYTQDWHPESTPHFEVEGEASGLSTVSPIRSGLSCTPP